MPHPAARRPTALLLPLLAAAALPLLDWSNGPAPVSVARGADAPPPPTVRLENAAYVGVETTAASAALREQLGLPPGVGVIVDATDPDSPAARAGLCVHDVVTKLDDQLVINVEQFSVLVRLHHAGETVKLGLIRRGRPLTLPVQLTEKAMPVLDDVAALRVAAPVPGRTLHASNIIAYSDGAHVITITARDDDQQIRVADRSGAVLYEGPLNTAADRAKLPEDLRPKIDAIERNWQRFKELRGNPAAKPDTPPQ